MHNPRAAVRAMELLEVSLTYGHWGSHRLCCCIWAQSYAIQAAGRLTGAFDAANHRPQIVCRTLSNLAHARESIVSGIDTTKAAAVGAIAQLEFNAVYKQTNKFKHMLLDLNALPAPLQDLLDKYFDNDESKRRAVLAPWCDNGCHAIGEDFLPENHAFWGNACAVLFRTF